MGKKRKLQHATNKPAGRPKKLSQHKNDLSRKPNGSAPSAGNRPTKKTKPLKDEAPTIPFKPHDRILLIGEGDLSFATSLIKHHGCTNVTATVLEKDEEELLAKYPHAEANIALIRGEPLKVEKDKKGQEGEEISEDKKDSDEEQNQGDDQAEEQSQDQEDEPNDDAYSDDDFDSDDEDRKPSHPRNNKLLFNIDATKPPPFLTRTPHTHIIFNFPHTGGKSTDINRQVRHNQSLLVSFFQRALPCLSPGGSIIVTLFEGEPYTLWNIRDLGRHAGLAVERSFRFQSAAYPGYHHARTLGVVRNRKGEVGGGWRGEERQARSYVFRRKGDVSEGGKKRKKGDDSSDDEDD